MSESRAPSPKAERPEVTVTDTEDENFCPPGPTTRAQSKKKAVTNTKPELELSTLLKFIKTYDGSRETLNSFLVNCNNAYDLASDPQKDILFKYILCQLQGKAQTACSIKEFSNWTQLKEFLKTQFSERKHYAHLLTDLQECRQQSNETVSQYALKIEKCLSQLLTEISISHEYKNKEIVGRTAAMEELALHHFLMGLLTRLSNIVRCKSPKTLNEAVNMAISEEKIQQYLYKQNSPSSRPNFPRPNTLNTRHFQSNPSRPSQLRPSFPNRPANNNYYQNPTTPICRYCKAPGHTLEQCRKRQYNNNKFRTDDNSPRTPQRVHFLSDTPEDQHLNETDEGYDTVDAGIKNE